MKVAIFSTKSYDRQFFTAANAQHQHQLIFLEPKLVGRASPLENRHTAILAKDATAVCIFVNDEVDRDTLESLASHHVSLIALRCAGYNNVDVETAKNLGIKLVRVPAYSPYAVAEHTMELSQLFSQSDIITLHCPLTPENYHLINKQAISQMKPHVMLINTSRGALIDTGAIITALKSSQIGALGLDVYEQESALFFEDRLPPVRYANESNYAR